MTTYEHTALTGKIIKACFDVHNYLGRGFPEVIYQRALSYELDKAGIAHTCEVPIDIFYKDKAAPLGFRKVDLIVEDKVLVELKAISELEKAHYAQALNYLKIYRYQTGLLINFGGESVEVKRLIHTPSYRKGFDRDERNNHLSQV
jgi:GxxExxY protein